MSKKRTPGKLSALFDDVSDVSSVSTPVRGSLRSGGTTPLSSSVKTPLRSPYRGPLGRTYRKVEKCWGGFFGSQVVFIILLTLTIVLAAASVNAIMEGGPASGPAGSQTSGTDDKTSGTDDKTSCNGLPDFEYEVIRRKILEQAGENLSIKYLAAMKLSNGMVGEEKLVKVVDCSPDLQRYDGKVYVTMNKKVESISLLVLTTVVFLLLLISIFYRQ